MQNLLRHVRSDLANLWRFKWYAAGAAWIVCVLGWVALDFVPDIYETRASLFVDTDAVLFPLLKGIAVDTETTNKLEVLQKNILSHENIDKLVTIVFPAVAPAPNDDRERLVRRLMTDIHVTSQDKNQFAVSYRNRDPRIARDVVKNAISIFLKSQNGTAHEQMEDAQQFLQQQIDTYEQQLTAAENRRAQYLAAHTDILQGEGNFAAHLASARSALETTETERADAEVRLNALQQQLGGIPKLLSIDALPGIAGAPVLSAAQRLAEAEENLNKLRLRYTEAYPDVVTAEKLVAALRATAASAPGPSNTTDSHSAGPGISNPVYEQVRLKIVELRTNIASLDIKIGNAKTNVENLEKLAREAPAIEAEYKRLDRDYTVLKSNHDELLSRLQSARIASAADENSDRQKLQITDPPRIAQLPVQPKRPFLISIILLVGLSAGIGTTFGLKYLDHSFRTPQMLSEFQLPVLGSISLLADGPARQRAFNGTIGFIFAIVSLFVVYGGLVAHAAGLGPGV